MFRFKRRSFLQFFLTTLLFEINTKDCMAGSCVGKLLLNGIDVNLVTLASVLQSSLEFLRFALNHGRFENSQ
jgi:hypothetical protein